MCAIVKGQQEGGDGIVLYLDCDYTNMECVT